MPTQEELSILQNLPLDLKIQKSKIRIREFIDNVGDFYVSFSGGKDSEVLLCLVAKTIKQYYPNRKIDVCFVNTGLEYSGIRNFAKTFCDFVSSKYGVDINFNLLKPKMSFSEVIQKYGYPATNKETAQYVYDFRRSKSEKFKEIRLNGNKYGRGKIPIKFRFLIDAPFIISDRCCTIMKKKPSADYEKKNMSAPILGSMATESQLRRTKWLKGGCNIFDAKRPNSSPMSFWTEDDVLKYIYENNLPIASPYGEVVKTDRCSYCTTKLTRTGCTFCLFGIHNKKEQDRLLQLKALEPKKYDFVLSGGGV